MYSRLTYDAYFDLMEPADVRFLRVVDACAFSFMIRYLAFECMHCCSKFMERKYDEDLEVSVKGQDIQVSRGSFKCCEQKKATNNIRDRLIRDLVETVKDEGSN